VENKELKDIKQFSLAENGKIYNYEITLFPAKQGIKIAVRLGKIVLPVLFSLIGSIPGGSDDIEKIDIEKAIKENLNVDILSESVNSLASNMDADEVCKLIDELMSVVLLKESDTKSEPVNNIFDRHFQCRYMSIFKIVKEVIQVNGFFGDLVKTAAQKK
jgi:hypothetical protein